MNKSASIVVVGLIMVLAASGISACSGSNAPAQSAPVAAPTALTPGNAFICPMHPEVTSGTPGDCPKCGMHLIPKTVYDADTAHAQHLHGNSTSSEALAAPAPAAQVPKPVAEGAPAATPGYVCTMCPEVTATAPGNCSKCGMHLVKG